MSKQLNMDDFYKKYTGDPAFNSEGEPGQEGRMETYEPHIERVKEQYTINPGTVWTILEEDGKLYICAGYHWINRFLY